MAYFSTEDVSLYTDIAANLSHYIYIIHQTTEIMSSWIVVGL